MFKAGGFEVYHGGVHTKKRDTQPKIYTTGWGGPDSVHRHLVLQSRFCRRVRLRRACKIRLLCLLISVLVEDLLWTQQDLRRFELTERVRERVMKERDKKEREKDSEWQHCIYSHANKAQLN